MPKEIHRDEVRKLVDQDHWPRSASTQLPPRLIPEMTEVELRHVPGCPHIGAARALLKECLTELKLDMAFEDKEGEYPSPTILVNGEDVMGAPASQAASCRLDIPTRPRLLAALRRT